MLRKHKLRPEKCPASLVWVFFFPLCLIELSGRSSVFVTTNYKATIMWTKTSADCFLELYDITNRKQHNLSKKKTRGKRQSSTAVEISGKLFLKCLFACVPTKVPIKGYVVCLPFLQPAKKREKNIFCLIVPLRAANKSPLCWSYLMGLAQSATWTAAWPLHFFLASFSFLLVLLSLHSFSSPSLHWSLCLCE